MMTYIVFILLGMCQRSYIIPSDIPRYERIICIIIPANVIVMVSLFGLLFV